MTSGLYIHIPFCASRCIYCGFYSTTLHHLRQRYLDALCREMSLRSLPKSPSQGPESPKPAVTTIYLGGGTPSQLSAEQLRQLFLYINKVYDTSLLTEVTIECNPDDITPLFAESLSQLPVNRVSMGVQTFSNERLRFLHRRHTAQQIPQAVSMLRQWGIGNISIDLMYGFPGETLEEWHHDITQALALGAEHLSAYSLMYEEGTPLHQLLTSGKLEELDEETQLQMYSDLIDRLKAAGYEHYEISNFARSGFRSRHNSSYWQGVPYTGLGAAAHSYDGMSCRRWNTASVETYIEGIEHGLSVSEEEFLDEDIHYNECVMTRLRTCEGLPLSLLSPPQRAYCLQQARPFLTGGLLIQHADCLTLTRQGLFVSNMVMSGLMKV